MTRRVLIGALFCLAAAIAQAKPNFSGTWKLNVAASDFGPMPNKPEKATTVIEHADPSLRLTSNVTGPQGQRVTRFKYTTDGAEVSNVNGPVEMKSAAKWNGDTLVIHSKGKLQGNDLTFIDTWSLSADGKTATLSRHIIAPQGEFDQTYKYDSQ